MKQFKNNIAKIISEKHENLNYEDIFNFLEKPKNKEFGDTALPCFKFSRDLKKSPVAIAEMFESYFEGSEYFENITNVNGYLNFKYAKKIFISSILESILSGKMFDDIKAGNLNKTMVIDFSSPNIAKKVHLGTFRSTAIGNSIHKIYKEMGWKVVKINHLGDWGTQFGKLMSAYKNWGNEEELKKNPMSYLQKIYVEFNKKSENDETLIEESREWFLKLEQGDKEAKELWEQFRKYTIEDLHKSYKRIGVEFDYIWGEAYYEKMLPAMMNEIEKSDISMISEGALVIDLEEYNMPPCLIRKSNGASIYATRDITAAKYRYEQFAFDKMLYVVGSPQQLHFNQVFKSLELLGYEWSKKCEFIGFGQILGLSTRKGTAVYLDTIFDEAKSRILKIIKEKENVIANSEEIADKIGIGAVIFQDLSKTRIKDSEFDWDRVLAFDGETGPYVQYSFVRIFNILKKIPDAMKQRNDIDFTVLTDESSYNLISVLSNYAQKLTSAFTESEPYIIANYLIDLSKAANKFYRNNRVVGEDDNKVIARAALLTTTKNIFERCMDIIGIPVIEEM